jgi:hypothetical protein
VRQVRRLASREDNVQDGSAFLGKAKPTAQLKTGADK